MKSIKYSIMFIIAITFMAGYAVFAQSDTFSDVNVEYSFILPESKWKMTVKPSATSPNVEYVYGDRKDGHLEVRKQSVAKDTILTDLIREEEQKLQFRRGYVSGKEENFTGKLRGTVFNFEYVASGRNMSGRFYFLKANDTTVYVLRFTGQKDEIRSLRNQTDSIARTFGINP